MQRVILAGEVDPSRLSDYQTSILWGYLTAKSISAGDVLLPDHYDFVLKDEKGESAKCMFQLTTAFVYRGLLDPSCLTVEIKPVIDAVLKKTNQIGYIPAGFYPHADDVKTLLQLFVLKYGITSRQKFDGQLHYDLIDEWDGGIGKGFFGKVYPLFGTLKPRYSTFGNLLFSAGSDKRIAKIQRLNQPIRREPAEAVRREHALSKRISYLSVRDFKLMQSPGPMAYMTLRKLQGENLRSTLSLDKKGVKTLSVNDRFSIMIQLMRGFKVHVHGNGILHRDIKPDNVMTAQYAKTPFWVVRPIDFGLSIDVNTYTWFAVGTPLYMAPEIITQTHTRASDIYSLGRVIGLIWRDKELKKYKNTSISDFQMMRIKQDHIEFDLFDDIEVDDSTKQAIIEILRQMTHLQPQLRSDLSVLINQCEEVRLAYLQSQIKDPVRCQGLSDAKEAAMDLLAWIDSSNLQADEGAPSLADFRAIILSSLDKLNDDPDALSLFISILGIQRFYPHQSKAALRVFVSNLVLSFTEAYDDWWRMMDKLENFYLDHCKDNDEYHPDLREQFEKYLKHSELFSRHFQQKHFDIDALHDLTLKIRRKIDALNEASLYFRGEQFYQYIDTRQRSKKCN